MHQTLAIALVYIGVRWRRAFCQASQPFWIKVKSWAVAVTQAFLLQVRCLPPVSVPHHLSARTHRLCAGALTSGRCTTPSPPSGHDHRICSFSVTTDMFPTGALLAASILSGGRFLQRPLRVAPSRCNAAHSCAQEGCSGN